jgi:hypothetical protein
MGFGGIFSEEKSSQFDVEKMIYYFIIDPSLNALLVAYASLF